MSKKEINERSKTRKKELERDLIFSFVLALLNVIGIWIIVEKVLGFVINPLIYVLVCLLLFIIRIKFMPWFRNSTTFSGKQFWLLIIFIIQNCFSLFFLCKISMVP